jgi:hypothetical protein
MLKIKTYRDEEQYRILNETMKMFYDAHAKFHFKNIGEKNNIINTVWALVMLSFRLRWLSESILSCTDFYSVAIIYRALIEHFFKHIYIYLSCIVKGDNIAKAYVSAEHMSSEMLKKLRKFLWPDNLESTKYITKPDEFKEFKKRVNEIAKKFIFSEVVTSILELSDKYYPDPNELQKALRSEIVRYSTLSSYVHAGPVAVLNLEKKPKKDIDMSSVLLTIIAHKNTIELLSRYPSENQNELKTLEKEIHEKVKKLLAIYEKNYVSPQ